MASGDSSQFPEFEEIIKRGSVSEPRSSKSHLKMVKKNPTIELNTNPNQRKRKPKQMDVSSEACNDTKSTEQAMFVEDGFTSDTSKEYNFKRRTPMTLPRTKITSATPHEQRMALRNLKQKLLFEEKEKHCASSKSKKVGEENAESDGMSMSSLGISDLSEINVGKMNERLEQVREYLKQATSMYVSLSIAGSDDPKRVEQMSKLAQLIQQLRIQEEGYVDLFQKTLTVENAVIDATSIVSTENSDGPSNDTDVKVNQFGSHQLELERLQEQQTLLKKIAEQQKELCELKEKQAALLQMQKSAESLIQHQKALNNTPNNQRSINQEKTANALLLVDTSALQKNAALESELLKLQDKENQMNKVIASLKLLQDKQSAEEFMGPLLSESDSEDIASEIASSVTTATSVDNFKKKIDEMTVAQRMSQLQDVRKRLRQLHRILSEYEVTPKEQTVTNANKHDNRLHAQILQVKEAGTINGKGEAKPRFLYPIQQNVLMNNLQDVEIRNKDNRNRTSQKKYQTDSRSTSSVKKKNTNQEKKRHANLGDLDSFLKGKPTEHRGKLRNDGQPADQSNYNPMMPDDQMNSSQQEVRAEIRSERFVKGSVPEKNSDIESNSSSFLQWQNDPEFQNKVKKLQMAKEKLRHLQQLVRLVQQGVGPHIPVDDLENLTILLSDDQNDLSVCGESEEEAAEDNVDESEEQSDDELGDGEQTEDCKSEVSKSTDMNYSFEPDNGLSDNEKRYQGLLRKQRLELNYLLKERERLIQAQQKLSSIAVQKPSNGGMGLDKNISGQKKAKTNCLTLTKEELGRQGIYKEKNSQDILLSKLRPMADSNSYVLTDEIDNESEEKVLATAPVTNPLAVSEIRRQRDLFEQKKKEKFVEKQQRKKVRNLRNDMQFDDRATYSIHSDIDEGVGVSMHSADVTTAATWGGSTEQSSSDQEDSAVGEEFAAVREAMNQHGGESGNTVDHEECGSHFDQAEEEEEVPIGVKNPSAVFKGNRYSHDSKSSGRRGITWYQNDVTPESKQKTTEEEIDATQGNDLVSWSLGVSPPQERRKPRQGNLTPAHKLIQDRKIKCSLQKEQQDHKQQQFSEVLETKTENSAHFLNQLANMCNSLLQNEHILLSILKSQSSISSMSKETLDTRKEILRPDNQSAMKNMRDFFQIGNRLDKIKQTLSILHTCSDRIEQHKLEMEYLQHQFSLLDIHSQENNNRKVDLTLPSKDSPHISLLNNPGESEMKSSAALFNPTQSMLDVFKPKKLSFQKGTQTHSTQHQEPFRPTIQPYTLYGEEISGTRSGSPSDKNDNGFLCRPVVEQTSQGAVRDNHSIHMVDEQYSGQCNSEDNIAYPYQLKLSDYNPLSYQGNFPNTFTGNVLTMSRMSMNKDHGQTNVTNQPEKIWPSFFKLNDPAMTDIGLLKKPFKSTTSVSEKSLSTRKERSKQVETDGPSDSNLVLTASSGDSNFSLFEALRDSIYSEVATLIAMNESRPHYLIELFRELQLLNSDYLRQRALYSLQELVTRFLTEEQVNPLPGNEVSNQETESTLENKVPVFEKWTHSASEQTPSESLITTDDEAEAQALRSLAKQIQNNDMYDYAEIVESQSECNLSSPGSHSENPFAAEDLGNTVINLDEALHKMRFYEQKMTNAKRMFDQIARDAEASTASSVKLGGSKYQGPVFGGLRLRLNNQIDVASASSVCDVLSDASSDMPQPSLDTEKLDQQIKSVMIDLIPFLNKSIESTCTDDILDQIRSHIVKSAKEKEPEAEKEKFGRFFHLQLDSILRDSLIKFQGRKIKECGEDILIDVSEILFNELAFFRLMQDLDRPFSADVVGASRQLMDEKGKTSKMPFIEDARCRIVDSNVATPEEYINTDTKSNSNSSTLSSNFVLVDHFETDEETESTRQFVKVELSASESKPVRSSGSGEDENEVQLLSFAQTTTPSPSMQVYSKQKQALAQGETPEEVELQVEINKPDQDIGAIQSEDVRYEANQYPPEDKSNEKEQEEIHMENENAEDQGNLDGAEVEADNRDCLLNPQSQNEVEDDDAAEDDLPEADMIADSNIAIADVILAHMDGRQETAQGSNLIEPS